MKEVSGVKYFFDDIEIKYASRTIIQLTDVDVGMGFAYDTFDEKGDEIAQVHSMVRMSHELAKRLHTHLGDMLEEAEKNKSKDK